MRHGFQKRKRQASIAHMPASGMDMLEDFMGAYGSAECTLP